MSAADYHYVLTIQFTVPGRTPGTATRTGVLTIRPGGTRQGALNAALGAMRAENPDIPQTVGILTFTLEPNDL